MNVPIGIAVALIGRLVSPETPRHPSHFDLAGALSSTLGMAALAYAFVRVASDGWSDIEAIVSFVAGGGVLPATFVIVEMLAAHR